MRGITIRRQERQFAGVPGDTEMILKICTECKNMMYYANMQAENQRKTGYIIGKNASSDSRHLLRKSRKR